MTQYDINLREYWRILKKRKLIVIITAVVVAAASFFLAKLNAPEPLYSATCSIKFEKETTLEGLYRRTLSWSEGDDIETQLSIVTGYTVLTELAKRLGFIPQDGSIDDPGANAIVENLKSQVKVERENYTNIINLTVIDRSPASAQKIANELARTYRDLHSQEQGKRTREALRYIEEQLATVRQRLRKAEEEFNKFSQTNQLISIDMQSETLLLRKKELTDEIRRLDEDEVELTVLLRRLNDFLKNPSSTDTNFYSTKASQQYQATNNSMVENLLKRESLLEDFTDQHPDVISIGLKIVENSRKMVMLLKLQMDTIEQRKTGLNAEVEAVNEKTNSLMEKKLEFDRLKREVDSSRDMTALLETKNQEALITKAEKPDEVVIVKPALQSSYPINPPKTAMKAFMGLIIGIVLGLILAFIIETFDTSIGAIEDVEETLGAKVLGVIPQIDAKDILSILKDRYPRELDESETKKLITLASHYAPKTIMAESFRALRTNIQFAEEKEKIKTIAITSTSPQEGKTLVSINLAVSMAQAGVKTLLVGADLRKPRIGHAFGLEEYPGLADVILGTYPWTDTVKTVTDIIMGKMSMDEVMMTPGLDNLSIITGGTIPPNPAELIESDRLVKFIEEAKEKYDLVIFDTTPVLSAADAIILGTKVDSVLIVYKVGAVSKGLLKRTATQLKQVNCNITGVILNGMKPDISPDFPSYKYYQYFSYYSDTGKDKLKKPKKPFNLFPWKRGNAEKPLSERISDEEEIAASVKVENKKGLFIKTGIIAAVFLVLLGGILQQSGVIDPLKYFTGKGPETEQNEAPSGADKAVKEKEKEAPKAEPVDEKTLPEDMPEAEPIDEEPLPEEAPEVEPVHEEPTQEELPIHEDEITESKTDAQDEEKIIEQAVGPVSYPSGSFPYSVFLGSFRTIEEAERAISIFASDGILSYPVKVNLNDKGIWHRIYAGHFQGHEEAEEFIKEYDLIDASVKKVTYAVMIEDYRTSADRMKIEELLKLNGFSPFEVYEIEDLNGNFHLLSGAFITEEGALSRNEELKAAGINSQVIKR